MVSITEHFVEQSANSVNILVAHLHEDNSAFRQEIPRYRQPVPQVR
jgi:hypothetical protein